MSSKEEGVENLVGVTPPVGVTGKGQCQALTRRHSCRLWRLEG